MASTRLGYLALKKEATKATAVKPTNFVRFREGDIGFNQEVIEANPIMNNRWNPLTAVPGKISTDAEFKADVDAKEIGHFLYAALGSYSKATLSGTAIKHTFGVANDLPSYSIEQLKGNPSGTDFEVIRAYGALLDSFEISGSDGICELSAKLKAHGVFVKGDLTADATSGTGATVDVKDTRGLVATDVIKLTDDTNTEDTTVATVASQTQITADLTNSYVAADNARVELLPQTPSFSSQALPFSFVHANFQFGADLTAAASAAETNVENWTFSFENGLEERYGSNAATPSVIAPKGATAKLKFTKYFENSEDRDAYLNLTQKAVILTLDLGTKIGATTYTYKLTVKIADMRFTSYEMPTGTDELYAVDLEGTCFYDTTTGKAVEIELQNDIADYAA